MRISDWSSDVCSSDLLAQRLRHQARLKPDVAVAHFAFDFGARNERGDRVDDEHVDRVRTHERVDDLERLFAGVGLRHDQFVDVDAKLAGIDRIERMFRSEEHTSELQSLMRNSYSVLRLKK